MNSLKAENIANFENINFYLPSTVKDGDTALELTSKEQTDLTKSTVSAYLENATGLTVESKINLIKTAGTLTNPKATNTSNVKVDIAGLIDVVGDIAVDASKKLLQLGFDGDKESGNVYDISWNNKAVYSKNGGTKQDMQGVSSSSKLIK